MSPPARKTFSLWSKLWLALWAVSGVVMPVFVATSAFAHLSGQAAVPDQATALLWCVVVNVVASIGLGMSLENTMLIGLALLCGWFIMAALFLAGCNGF